MIRKSEISLTKKKHINDIESRLNKRKNLTQQKHYETNLENFTLEVVKGTIFFLFFI